MLIRRAEEVEVVEKVQEAASVQGAGGLVSLTLNS